jgi:hypothetical protein
MDQEMISGPSTPSENARSNALQSPGIQPCLCPPVLASTSHRRRPLSCSADSGHKKVYILFLLNPPLTEHGIAT